MVAIERSPPSTSFDHDAAIATLPFEASGSSMFLPVQVNGSRPMWFILDSGANTCVIDRARARELGLEPVEQRQGTGAGAGPIDFWKFKKEAVSFTVHSVRFDCEHVGAIDLSSNFEVTGRDLDGIIGTDFFTRFVVETDYVAEVVRLYDPRTYNYRGQGDTIPLTFSRRLPYVVAKLTVAGIPPADRTLLVDSGSEDAVDDSLILRSRGPRQEVVGGVGLGEEYTVVFGLIDRVQLGPFTFDNVPSVAPGVQLIGGAVLRRFTVVYDFPRRRLFLEPNQHFTDSFDNFGQSGVVVRLASDRKRLRVHEVRPNSSGAAAGLREDDLIVAIDGISAEQFGLRRVERMFQARGRVYRLSVQRGGETVRVALPVR